MCILITNKQNFILLESRGLKIIMTQLIQLIDLRFYCNSIIIRWVYSLFCTHEIVIPVSRYTIHETGSLPYKFVLSRMRPFSRCVSFTCSVYTCTLYLRSHGKFAQMCHAYTAKSAGARPNQTCSLTSSSTLPVTLAATN